MRHICILVVVILAVGCESKTLFEYVFGKKPPECQHRWVNLDDSVECWSPTYERILSDFNYPPSEEHPPCDKESWARIKACGDPPKDLPLLEDSCLSFEGPYLNQKCISSKEYRERGGVKFIHEIGNLAEELPADIAFHLPNAVQLLKLMEPYRYEIFILGAVDELCRRILADKEFFVKFIEEHRLEGPVLKPHPK